MKEHRRDGSNFEQRLLDELKAVVAQSSTESEPASGAAPSPGRPGWRPARRLALGTAAALAIAAAVFVVSSGSEGTPKAFAVETQDGGGVTIKVYSPEDASGLEAALAEAGIRSQVTWLPNGETCREPRFTPSTAKTSLGGRIGGIGMGGPGPALTIGVMTAQQWQERRQEFKSGEISEAEYHASTANVSFDPDGFRSDQTVVISGSRGPYYGNPEGGYEAEVQIAEGPVQACEPVPVPSGGMLEETNRVLEAEAAQGGAE